MQYINTCKHELYPSFLSTLFYVFYLSLAHFLENSFDGKSFWSFVYVIYYGVGARMTALMSISDGLDPYFFPSKGGKNLVYERRTGRKGVYFRP